MKTFISLSALFLSLSLSAQSNTATWYYNDTSGNGIQSSYTCIALSSVRLGAEHRDVFAFTITPVDEKIRLTPGQKEWLRKKPMEELIMCLPYLSYHIFSSAHVLFVCFSLDFRI